MKKLVKILAALMICGALSFGTAEASENPEALEFGEVGNSVAVQELKWPPPRHHYDPPHHHRHHEPPHFHRRPNDFDPPRHHHYPPPRRHHRW